MKMRQAMTIDDVRKIVLTQAEKEGGIRAYARRLGLSAQYVSKVCSDLESISQKILDDIGVDELGRVYALRSSPIRYDRGEKIELLTCVDGFAIVRKGGAAKPVSMPYEKWNALPKSKGTLDG